MEFEELRCYLDDYDKMCNDEWKESYVKECKNVLAFLFQFLNQGELYFYYR